LDFAGGLDGAGVSGIWSQLGMCDAAALAR
jgi:hypothetical protein